MPLRTVRFKIRQDGLVEETVEGVKGHMCQKLTENLESALGAVIQTEPTADSFLVSQKNPQLNSAEVH